MTELIRCEKGHYYNPKIDPVCPECAKQAGGNAGGRGAAAPVYGGAATMADGYGRTMPTNSSLETVPPYGRGKAPVESYGGTMPVNSFETVPPEKETAGATETQEQEATMKTEPAYVGVPGYGPTVPVTPGNTEPQGPIVGIRPVVGWLVCVEGVNKGRDYRVYDGYNYIGRSESNDICIKGDPCISNENSAMVGYDYTGNAFYVGPGMGHNIVRLNGKMLIGQALLNAYDIITVGKTRLVFVPLCNERFSWYGNAEK